MTTGSSTLLQPRRKAIGYGVIGGILILVGVKIALNSSLFRGSPLKQGNHPVILFFNIGDPCDCIRELVAQAGAQMGEWERRQNGKIQVARLAIGDNLDLEAKYNVFRAPALVLLDVNGQIAWRQDYPLIEGGPFKLQELESALTSLEEGLVQP